MNLEGIKLSEVKESELEKKSITVDDDYSFDDCGLTQQESLENKTIATDDAYNFDDCGLTQQEYLEILQQRGMDLSIQQQNYYNNDDIDEYENCKKR